MQTYAGTGTYAHIHILTDMHTCTDPRAQTLWHSERPTEPPETKGGLRQLTLLLLVSAGTQRRERREA